MRDVVHHVGGMRRYARSLCRDPSEADDIVQETLERALRHVDQFQADGNLRAWLFGILHNVFVSRTRAVARTSQRLNELREGAESAAAASQESSADLRRVLDLVDRLPLEQRQVVLLVSVEGFSTAEVADQLALPVGTARSRLARGREALRDACRDLEPAVGKPAHRSHGLRLVGGRHVEGD